MSTFFTLSEFSSALNRLDVSRFGRKIQGVEFIVFDKTKVSSDNDSTTLSNGIDLSVKYVSDAKEYVKVMLKIEGAVAYNITDLFVINLEDITEAGGFPEVYKRQGSDRREAEDVAEAFVVELLKIFNGMGAKLKNLIQGSVSTGKKMFFANGISRGTDEFVSMHFIEDAFSANLSVLQFHNNVVYEHVQKNGNYTRMHLKTAFSAIARSLLVYLMEGDTRKMSTIEGYGWLRFFMTDFAFFSGVKKSKKLVVNTLNPASTIELGLLNNVYVTSAVSNSISDTKKEFYFDGYEFDDNIVVSDFTNVIKCPITGGLFDSMNTNLVMAHNSHDDEAGCYYVPRYLRKLVIFRQGCSRCHSYVMAALRSSVAWIEEKFGKSIGNYEYFVAYNSIVDAYSPQSPDYVCSSCLSREERVAKAISGVGTVKGNKIYTDAFPEGQYYYSDISSWDYSPDIQQFGEGGDDALRMGCEIEIDGGGEDDFNAGIIQAVFGLDHVYAMHDGSLSDGFEIATMPATLEYHRNNIPYADAFKVAVRLGYRSHETTTCGLHVHINRSFFGRTSKTQNIKAAYMALIMERNWDDLVTFSRRDYRRLSDWARKKELNGTAEASDTDSQIISKFSSEYGYDKYVALNCLHSETYELRIFKGTLLPETYFATLQFVDNLARLAKSITSLTAAQQVTFSDIINYNPTDELVSYCQSRGLSIDEEEEN